MRRAGFLRKELAADIGNRIFFQRDARVAALLRAVVDQPILANVEVSCARAAAPVVGFSFGDVVLEAIDAREAALFQIFHFMINALLFAHPAAAIVRSRRE